jgi:hypothetical protein
VCDDNFSKASLFIESVPRFDLNIISTFPESLNEFRNRKSKLLDCGSRDDLNSSDFHGKCESQSDTITFIQTTKYFVSGGYTPLSWNSTNSCKANSSHRSFVFSIVNPHNFGPRKFALKSNHSQCAISCYASVWFAFWKWNHNFCVHELRRE